GVDFRRASVHSLFDERDGSARQQLVLVLDLAGYFGVRTAAADESGGPEQENRPKGDPACCTQTFRIHTPLLPKTRLEIVTRINDIRIHPAWLPRCCRLVKISLPKQANHKALSRRCGSLSKALAN